MAHAFESGTAGIEVRDESPPLCFTEETGFCIHDPKVRAFFDRNGGVEVLGFPISREFVLEGFPVQFFQRVVLQVNVGDGVVRPLNLLDRDIMPMTRAHGSIFPQADRSMIDDTLRPDSGVANYPTRVTAFVQMNVPDVLGDSLPVRFKALFYSATADLTGNLSENDRTLRSLEIWGLPTSHPTVDPASPRFIYQRFQRGIMQFDSWNDADCPASRPTCSRGLLIGEYFKQVVTGQDLPADLAAEMQNSRFYKQYQPPPGQGAAPRP
jgi:hypothetical protein